MEKARRGTKCVMVEMEVVKGEDNERSEIPAFMKTSLALPRRQSMPMYVEVRHGDAECQRVTI